MKPCRPSAFFMRLPGEDTARRVVHWLLGIVQLQLVVAAPAMLRPNIVHKVGNRFDLWRGVVKFAVLFTAEIDC